MTGSDGVDPQRHDGRGVDAAPSRRRNQPAPAPAPVAADPAAVAAVVASEPHPPVVEAPSSDVALAEDASPMPGAHRGGFSRLPTAPIGVTTEFRPTLEPEVRWAEPAPAPPRGRAVWALTFAILGLVVSLFVGWGLPLGIAAIVAAILALRHPLESRTMAIWALALAMVSIAYSALWLAWAATRANLFG